MSRKKQPPELDGEAGWKDQRAPCNLDPDKADEQVCDKCPSDIRNGCLLATPRTKRTKAYLDCPTCPYCGSKTGLGPTQHPLGDKSLLCACCGKDWIGTVEQIEQANRADAAWDRRQDNAKGPRRAYVGRRSRRFTDQLNLFVKTEVVDPT